jgi:DDE superfamily endonuclease/Helix-turn-helix of DDE superfamily endonuclease
MHLESTTGLPVDLLEELIRRVEEAAGPGRVVVAENGGRPRQFSVREKVLVGLILLRQNLPQPVLAAFLGVSQSTVSRAWRWVFPLLFDALVAHEMSLEEAVDGRVTLIDGTDVPTGNRIDGQGNYSGKRRRQGLNIQVAADLLGRLLAVSVPVPGSRHDRAALELTGWEKILDNSESGWIADLGYLGTSAVTSQKKSKHRPLSSDRENYNRQVSGMRSAVERCIAHLKNWKMIATGYRGKLSELATIIRIVTRLESYRLGL